MMDQHGQRLKLRMVLIGRISTIVATWLVAVLVIALLDNLSSNTTYQVLVTLVPLLLAVPITVRLVRFGVDATADTVTVRGYKRAQRIPIRSIAQVQRRGVPRIIWMDEEGRERVARMPGLRADTRISRSNRRAFQAIEELAEWVERHRA